MVRPNLRSRTFRRIDTKMPGGESRIIYKRRAPGVPQCANCGIKLHGVPQTRAMHRVTHSSRRPQRPFGGELCTKCSRNEIKLRARGESHA